MKPESDNITEKPIGKSKWKRRNSEVRKERSKYAARSRRGRESDLFADLAQYVSRDPEKLDKTSVVRLTAAHLKFLKFSDEMLGEKIKPSVKDEIDIQRVVPGFLMVLTEEGDLVYVSRNVSEYLGMQSSCMNGNSLFEFVHESDYKVVKSLTEVKDDSNGLRKIVVRMKNLLTSRGKAVPMKAATYKVFTITGRYLQHAECKPLVKSASSRSSWFVAFCWPIVKPYMNCVELGLRSYLSKHLLDMSFTFVDDSMTEYLGYGFKDLLFKSVYAYVMPEDVSNFSKTFKSLFVQGQCETEPYRFLAKQGGYMWMITQASIIYSDKNKPLSIVCIHRRISDIESECMVLSEHQLPKENLFTSVKSKLSMQLTCKQKKQDIETKPIAVTEAMFTPRTLEMNSDYYVPAIEEVKKENDEDEDCQDLSYLSPIEGNVSVPLVIPDFTNLLQNLPFFEADLEIEAAKNELLRKSSIDSGFESDIESFLIECNSLTDEVEAIESTKHKRHHGVNDTESESESKRLKHGENLPAIAEEDERHLLQLLMKGEDIGPHACGGVASKSSEAGSILHGIVYPDLKCLPNFNVLDWKDAEANAPVADDKRNYSVDDLFLALDDSFDADFDLDCEPRQRSFTF